MSHPFDANLMFKTGADLTASESAVTLTIWGQVAKGAAVRVVVKDAFGANDTMLPVVHLSQDGTNFYQSIEALEGATKVKGGYEFLIPFPVAAGKNYVKLENRLTAASTTSLFEDVYAGIIPNIGPGFNRKSHWE